LFFRFADLQILPFSREDTMHKRTMITIWFVVLLFVGGTLLGACGGETTPTTPATTAVAPTQAEATEETIDAAALLEARCVDCHSLSRTTEARYTQEQWQQVVTRMIGQGAVLSPDEKAALVAYLAETYKP
jgi:hypothetical protein